jgi:transcriptional regulator with XRE-family HTH domain
MITNERQLQIAKGEIERFEAALEDQLFDAAIDPAILSAQREALTAQLEELRRDVTAYVNLKEGRVRTFEMITLSDLPKVLISARIASGMTQKELAERLSLKEQQIQRYETQNYEGASFARVADVADAIGLDVPNFIRLPDASSTEAVLKRAALSGIDANFIRRRIAPDADARSIVDRLGYVFDWSPDSLFMATPPELSIAGGATARFKMPKGRNARAVAAYTAYAYRLATICARTSIPNSDVLIPIEAKPMRTLIGRRGRIDFQNSLETAWDLGIIVLPLADSGQFHGACWRINGVNVVVLKQGDRSAARWLIDLLHEVFHAGRFPEQSNFTVLEEPETSEIRRDDPEEQQATWFASLVALDGRAEDLFKVAVETINGNLSELKQSIARTATREGVDAGVLANYAAYRLAMQNENWWGTAANLQDRSIDPLEITRETFFRRFDFSKLDGVELELLTLALHDEVQDG